MLHHPVANVVPIANLAPMRTTQQTAGVDL